MKELIKNYRSAIERELNRSIKPTTSIAAPFYRMLRYFLGWEDEKGRPVRIESGKRYRPALCLLVCEAICGRWRHALPAAAAIELFHNFTLIIDDIQDHDEFRRGRKTVWTIWGMEQAINAGLLLFGLSTQTALQSPKNREVIQILSKASSEIIEGQYLDLSFVHRDAISVSDYLTMLRAKTAVLVGAATEIGALMATDDKNARKVWRDFGVSFGLAFQLYDDYQGVWGKSHETGKEESGDIREGKKTLPLMIALERLPEHKAGRLRSLYHQSPRPQKAITEVRVLFEEAQANQEMTQRVVAQMTKAVQLLNRTGVQASTRKGIEQLVHQLIPFGS